MLRTRHISRSWGNCCHSCKIAILNSSIFWHFGLRWLIFRPIKSHTCSIGFMSGDIASHVIVWTASCCKKCCTIRALCGLALSSMNIGLSANAWLSKWGTTRGASTLSRYFWPVRLPSRTYKSNLQSKEKQPQTDTPPLPKAVVPNMWLSWNEVFRWCQTLARPSVGRNKKRLSSDQWTRLHVRIVHPKWSCDQSNRAWRWRNVNCWRFMGRRARIPWWWRRLITVRVLMWPPNVKLPRSAPAVLNGRCRGRLDMSRSSLGVVLWGLPARGRSVTFPVWRKRYISRTMMEWLTLKWYATLIWLRPPLCMPTACHLSGMVNFRRTIQTNRKWNLKLYTQKISFRSQTQMLKGTRGTLHTLSYTHK